ncbi:MAG: NAD(P)-dependent glycerol-3-phosphate dehydrogenase [Coxiellaceae bacterium]|nr:MAG: NAD(P)-dependent glycerol-3-phosphate dehydrogenase [Coxiellaceae bacterium]
MDAITVIGAGSWGTALALLLAHNGETVNLWHHRPEQIQAMAQQRCNARYLPDIPLPDNLNLQIDIGQALANAGTILLVVPSHAFARMVDLCVPWLRPNTKVVWGTKGLEPETGRLLHEVVAEKLGADTAMAVLSGPSFAREVALGMPTAVTIAANQVGFAAELQQQFHASYFRVYTSDDLLGVQVCGVVKNVLAIAVGASDGLGLGANARAALITRGLTEMARLGTALGGKRETFMGLAGLGDLVLTATDNQSRNRRFGVALGEGKDLFSLQQGMMNVTEGVSNVATVYRLAASLGVDMPIVEQVYKVLHQNLTPAAAMKALLMRDPKTERDQG